MLRRPLGGSGFRSTMLWLPISIAHSTHSLPALVFATQSPITCPKRQLPRTLYEMAAKIELKYIDKKK
jgi:hypothetical protein